MNSRAIWRTSRTRSDSEKSISASCPLHRRERHQASTKNPIESAIIAAFSQPGRLRLQAGGIERIEQRELRPDARQLPAEEVAAGGELAPVEVGVFAAGALQPARRRDRLAQ